MRASFCFPVNSDYGWETIVLNRIYPSQFKCLKSNLLHGLAVCIFISFVARLGSFHGTCLGNAVSGEFLRRF